MHDSQIEQIEADLRDSRFKPWDVETYLANRHRAKIEALTGEQSSPWERRWQAAKEMWWVVAGAAGTVTIATVLGFWLISGHWPYEKIVVVERYDSQGLLMPPPAPPAYPVDH